LTREFGKTCGEKGHFLIKILRGVKSGNVALFLSKKNCVTLPNIFSLKKKENDKGI
jgi:hypothetical protein